MSHKSLSDYFAGVAIKRLSSVETNPEKSNQHEINGVAKLQRLLGFDKKKLKATFLYLSDSESPISTSGMVTWYDAREAHPTRTEYRLYYPSNEVMEYASKGDLLVIGKRPNESLVLLVVEEGSTIESQVLWLFGEEQISEIFTIHDFVSEPGRKLDFVAKMILEQIGIDITETDEKYLDILLKRFGNKFPPTKEFSQLAREMTDVEMPYNPDEAILKWMNQEEILFRTFEQHFVNEKIREGFPDVDVFIQTALSVINRRKSRAGLALENHLEQILLDYKISYSRGERTERRSKPDFLFPNICVYRKQRFPNHLLTMLGVKTTCKDRWRQVLVEADRIKEKHLLTLEPGISSAQIHEMKENKLQLVVPSSIHKTYKEINRLWLWNLEQFIEFVKEREKISNYRDYC